MKVLAVAAVVAASFTFACGGDDDDSNGNGGADTGGTGANTTQTTGGAAGVLTTVAGGGNQTPSSGATGASSNTAAKTAVVTIGDARYEFTLNRDCRSLFGVLVGVGQSADGQTVVNMQIPPETGAVSEPSIRVDDRAKNLDWRAGGDVIGELAGVSAGDSQVDDFKNDGKRASGTATFLDMYAVLQGKVEPVQGRFEFACE